MSEPTSEPAKSYDEALYEWEYKKRQASGQTDGQTNGPEIPTSSVFCTLFAHLGLWGGMLVILISIIDKKPETAIIALSAVSSSLPLFVIAAHLRQQAVTNHLLGKIANKN